MLRFVCVVLANYDMNGMRSLKGAFPFRLGTTSYIIPDDIAPNVRFLADKVDDIELVLFESDELANIPSRADVRQLASLASDNGLSYTVHLPLDIHTGHRRQSQRQRSVEKCLRIIDRMKPLEPAAYLLHLDGDRRGGVPSGDIARWRDNHRRSVTEMLAHVAPGRLCVETLDYPLELVSDIVEDLKLGICLDIGHLLLYGYDVDAHLEKYLPRTRVIHLHGLRDGKDHSAISHLDRKFLAELWTSLAGRYRYRNILTLEIFGEKAFRQSVRALEGLIQE